jgi:hypothetical protein
MFGFGRYFDGSLGRCSLSRRSAARNRAEQIIADLRSSVLLGPFRGEEAVVREELVKTLMGLSRLAEDWADITEVDINPLVVGPDGRITAVDALIVMGDRPQASF